MWLPLCDHVRGAKHCLQAGTDWKKSAVLAGSGMLRLKLL
jgi:hypothetical protein